MRLNGSLAVLLVILAARSVGIPPFSVQRLDIEKGIGIPAESLV